MQRYKYNALMRKNESTIVRIHYLAVRKTGYYKSMTEVF